MPSFFAFFQAAESSFAEIRALVERRQAEVLQSIRRVSEEKRRALEDQLELIESERSLVISPKISGSITKLFL